MLMTFLLICFGGLAFMFYCIQKNQERIFKTLQTEHVQIRTILRAIEARLEEEPQTPGKMFASGSESLQMNNDDNMQMNEPPVFIEGATVAQAAELLRAAKPLSSLNLQMMGEPEKGKKHRQDAMNAQDGLKLKF